MTEPTPRSIIIGTAGHVDHGKTALIRRLTGINADRLQEEQVLLEEESNDRAVGSRTAKIATSSFTV